MNDWNYTDQELPEQDTGEQLELWWAGGPNIGYFDTGLFKDGSFWIPAIVPYGLGFADEGREYKKLINPEKWRYATRRTEYNMPKDLKITFHVHDPEDLPEEDMKVLFVLKSTKTVHLGWCFPTLPYPFENDDAYTPDEIEFWVELPEKLRK